MSDHDPLCPYSKPCPEEWRNARTIKAEGLPVPHRIVSGSGGRCVECDAGECFCYEMEQARADERARIRAAVWALRPWEYPDRTSINLDAVLAAIDAGGEP